MVLSSGGLANGGEVVELKIYEACCIVQWTRIYSEGFCFWHARGFSITAVEHGFGNFGPSYTASHSYACAQHGYSMSGSFSS